MRGKAAVEERRSGLAAGGALARRPAAAQGHRRAEPHRQHRRLSLEMTMIAAALTARLAAGRAAGAVGLRLGAALCRHRDRAGERGVARDPGRANPRTDRPAARDRAAQFAQSDRRADARSAIGCSTSLVVASEQPRYPVARSGDPRQARRLRDLLPDRHPDRQQSCWPTRCTSRTPSISIQTSIRPSSAKTMPQFAASRNSTRRS